MLIKFNSKKGFSYFKIFCLFPASTSIESKFSTTDLIMTDRRSRMKPQLFEDLSIVKFNN